MSPQSCSCRIWRETASAPAELIPCKHHEEFTVCAYCEGELALAEAVEHGRDYWHPACVRKSESMRALTDALREEWAL